MSDQLSTRTNLSSNLSFTLGIFTTYTFFILDAARGGKISNYTQMLPAKHPNTSTLNVIFPLHVWGLNRIIRALNACKSLFTTVSLSVFPDRV